MDWLIAIHLMIIDISKQDVGLHWWNLKSTQGQSGLKKIQYGLPWQHKHDDVAFMRKICGALIFKFLRHDGMTRITIKRMMGLSRSSCLLHEKDLYEYHPL